MTRNSPTARTTLSDTKLANCPNSPSARTSLSETKLANCLINFKGHKTRQVSKHAKWMDNLGLHNIDIQRADLWSSASVCNFWLGPAKKLVLTAFFIIGSRAKIKALDVNSIWNLKYLAHIKKVEQKFFGKIGLEFFVNFDQLLDRFKSSVSRKEIDSCLLKSLPKKNTLNGTLPNFERKTNSVNFCTLRNKWVEILNLEKMRDPLPFSRVNYKSEKTSS